MDQITYKVYGVFKNNSKERFYFTIPSNKEKKLFKQAKQGKWNFDMTSINLIEDTPSREKALGIAPELEGI